MAAFWLFNLSINDLENSKGFLASDLHVTKEIQTIQNVLLLNYL